MNDIRIVTLNIENDGLDGDGTPWEAAHDLLHTRRPHILLRQEVRDQEQCDRAAQRLGMTGFTTLQPHLQQRLRHHTAVLVDPTTFDIHDVSTFDQRWRSPTTNILVSLPDTPHRRMHLVSLHQTFNSVAGRRLEADDFAGLIGKIEDQPHRQGTNLIAGGDCNAYPTPSPQEQVPLINWSAPTITDDSHRWNRAILEADGTWTSDTYLDRMMTNTGMHDAARHAARHLNQPHATAPTAGHHPITRHQGGPCRIDRIYLDRWLTAAITNVEVLDTTGISDHHAVEVTLDRAGMTAALRRQLQPAH